MSFTKDKRERMKRQLVDFINDDDRDYISKMTTLYGITITSVRRYVADLLESNIITHSKDKACGFELVWVEDEYVYHVGDGTLEEHEIFGDILAPHISDYSESAKKIWPYVFVEIMNNAIEHSGGDKVICKIRRSYLYTDVIIADTGLGIFQRIKDYVKEDKGIDISTRDIILELHKGKLTISKYFHYGEGIFFVSKMLDYFAICSDNQVFFRGNDMNDSSLKAYLESYANKISGYGTTVWMELSNFSDREMQEVFDAFATDEDGFAKTTIPIREICRGAYPVARSLARRLTFRLEEFSEITLDFTDVPMIGQGFAHEVYVIFQNKFPNVRIITVNANDDVSKMINYVINTKN